MGKSSSAIVGFWYHPAFHMGISLGPIDALLEIRCGDLTAWSGNAPASGTINVNAPNLFGGEKDQGGIAGDFDLMMGEATQQPNAYLTQTFGNQQPAWRGLTTIVFKGGRYGAMNPYPQKISYKGLKTKAGWDDDNCWYPDQCEVPMSAIAAPVENATPWRDRGAGYFVIGAAQELSGPLITFQGWWHGYIDSFRITRGVARYTIAKYAIPTAAFGDATSDPYYAQVMLLLRMLGADGSTAITDDKGHVVSAVNGAAISTAQSRFGGSSAHFDGIDDFLQVEMGADENLGAGPWTMDAWVWLESEVVNFGYQRALFGYGPIGVSGSDTDWYCSGDAWRYLQVEAQTPAAVSVQQNNAPYMQTGRWAFVSICFDGARYWLHQDGQLLTATASAIAMNPAHILYYARTQQSLGRRPTTEIDDASHHAAADWFAAHGVGLCWDYDASQESVDQFIERIEKVAGCSQSRSPLDGKWYLDIANGEYDLASLPTLTDDDILDFQRQPATLDSAVNSVSVKYRDPLKKTDVITPPVQALALVTAFGTIHQDVSYLEIPTGDLAARIAERELRNTTTPTNGFELTSTRKPYAWRRGTYFRLQTPRRGIADMVCILGSIDTGALKSGAIKLTAAQDIYALPSTSFVAQESGVDTRPSPIALPVVTQTAFEAPYIEIVPRLSRADLAALPDDVGYAMAVATDPASSRDFTMTVSSGGGNTYADVGDGNWTPSAQIVEGSTLADALTTNFTLANADRLDLVTIGSAALWGSEIVRVDALDTAAGTITLGRGCADTVPAAHNAHSCIWFYPAGSAADTTEYTDGESIDIKLLTNTWSAQLDASMATPIAVAFAGRQSRPYPPANVTLNGEHYPSTLLLTGDLTIDAVHRDRVTQADQLIDQSMASVGPETGVTYSIRMVDVSSGATIYSADDIINFPHTVPAANLTVANQLDLYSVRAGLDSLQHVNIQFVVGQTLQAESGDAITTEDNQSIVMG